ncbi:hypothetical protein ACFE04_003398 [Oxalis oulophora]
MTSQHSIVMKSLSSCNNGEEEKQWLLLELDLGEELSKNFNLEKAVCSHGLFMMAPNQWDPLSKTLSRPLTLHGDDALDDDVMVRVSQGSSNCCLHVHVYANAHSLSPQHRLTILGQVVRMLRLSDNDEIKVREFRKIVESIHDGEEKEEVEYLKSFSGRVFRSPTLFEDMVKCMLLCNCQTLSMANALCKLQWELKHQSSDIMTTETESADSKSLKEEMEKIVPSTPAKKDVKRKLRPSKTSKRLTSEISKNEAYKPADVNSKEDRTGKFPSAKELANLDETYLAKRCNLGYRAGRIIKLSKAIVEGRIDLKYLEEFSLETNVLNYDKLAELLNQIDGFGPFTCANVLMCMGFYHVVPSDSETIRHLKQVHSRSSTIRTIKEDVEKIYKKFEPFQFLAYWSEIWYFYEKRFGKMSAMPNCDYKLITASNMKSEGNSITMKKRTRKKCPY